MISVEEAKKLVLDSDFKYKIKKTPILDSLGMVLG